MEMNYKDLTPMQQYSLLKIADGEKLHITEAQQFLLDNELVIQRSKTEFSITAKGVAVVRHLRPKLKAVES